MYKLTKTHDKKTNTFAVSVDINDYHYCKYFKGNKEADLLYDLLLDIKRECEKRVKNENIVLCDVLSEAKKELKNGKTEKN